MPDSMRCLSSSTVAIFPKGSAAAGSLH